jgi:AcrR family transcriptional regulator
MARRNRREQIMQAVEKLFTSRRFHEITLDDVAQAARVGKGTIYRYFQDKDDLFFQTATSGFDDLCDLLGRKVPDNTTFAEQLASACEQIGRFFKRRHQLFQMMQAEEDRIYWFTGTIRDRWMEKRQNLVSALAEIMRKGVGEGKVRNDIPAEVLANFFLGMLRTRARDLTNTPGVTQRHELLVDLFCRGATRPPETAGNQQEPKEDWRR